MAPKPTKAWVLAGICVFIASTAASYFLRFYGDRISKDDWVMNDAAYDVGHYFFLGLGIVFLCVIILRIAKRTASGSRDPLHCPE
jgi:hypothetical protein